MSPADDWGDEGEASPKKSGLSPWVLWGCGGGCLLLTLAVAAFGIFAGRLVREAIDPDKAWEGVRGLLAFEERPAGWKAFGTGAFGRSVFVLEPPGGGAVVVVQSFRRREEVAGLLDPASAQNRGFPWLERRADPEPGTLQLQGREAPCLYLRGGLTQDVPRAAHGIGVRIDVTGAGEPTLVHIALDETEGRVSPEQVAELLAPFDVWRGR
jgi:hypothetical protein